RQAAHQPVRGNLLGYAGRQRLAPGQILADARRQRRIAAQPVIAHKLSCHRSSDAGVCQVVIKAIVIISAMPVAAIVEIIIVATSVVISAIVLADAPGTQYFLAVAGVFRAGAAMGA